MSYRIFAKGCWNGCTLLVFALGSMTVVRAIVADEPPSRPLGTTPRERVEPTPAVEPPLGPGFRPGEVFPSQAGSLPATRTREQFKVAENRAVKLADAGDRADRSERDDRRAARRPDSMPRGSAAELLQRLLPGLGPSVLEGTELDKVELECDVDGNGPKRLNTREAFLESVRRMEREQERTGSAVRADAPAHATLRSRATARSIPAPMLPPTEDDEETLGALPARQSHVPFGQAHGGGLAGDKVHALRDAATALDHAADRLERQGMYERADEVRGLAAQLRLDARKGQPRALPSSDD